MLFWLMNMGFAASEVGAVTPSVETYIPTYRRRRR